ncbi:MAG: hypothetical protein QOI07_942 [Verrucomicrobiota bacterium]|jgi:hypothetical protein
MTEGPIIFNSEMICAIWDGRKTQTRRIVKPQWQGYPLGNSDYQREIIARCPYGVAGDRLWVRETFRITRWWKHGAARIRLDGFYISDGCPFCVVLTAAESAKFCKWKRKLGNFPSIFMFRSLSRILREITKVRVERLQDISEEDAEAEGCAFFPVISHATGYRYAFQHKVWDSLYGQGAWEKNPWVWVLEFKRV